MGVIMHNNIPYGGGSSIEPNPQESATDQLETLGIDGDVYEVTDANAAREVQQTITEAQSRTNLANGDDVPTIFGKIKKWFSDLKTVAFTGAYSDLSGTPTIPTVNDGTLTIQKNGTAVETFTANSSTDKTANITVPTKTSDLTNDSGFVTTDEKVTGELQNPSSGTWYYVPFIGTTNQKPYYNNGLRCVAKEGTASADGEGSIILGNSTASGTAGNKKGYVGLYANNSKLAYLHFGDSATADRAFALPDKSGTVALTSDLTSENIGAVPIRKDYDTYTQLAKWYGGTTEPPYVRIAFPTGISTVWTMLNIEILFRQNYANDLGGKILINCHHTTTSPYAWVGNAFVYGFVRKSDIKVYGSDGRYLYIKGIDSYTTLSIEKVLVGDTARSIDLTSTTIDYVSALPSTYQTFTMYTDVDSSNIANQSVDQATKDGDGNTISSTYLKNSNVLMKNGDANVSPAGYRNIGGTNDYITLSEAGTYLITAWAMFKGGTGNKAVLICRASDNAAYGQSWESSTINQSYPKTFTCFHVATVTSTTLYFRARVYTENTDVYGGISGGIYAIKVS